MVGRSSPASISADAVASAGTRVSTSDLILKTIAVFLVQPMTLLFVLLALIVTLRPAGRGAVGFVLRIPSCKRPGAPIAQHGNQPQGNRKRGGHVDIPLKTRLDRLFPGKTVDQIHSLQAALAGSHSLITGINTQGLGSMAPDGITFLLFQENPAAEGIDPPTLQSISVGRGFHRSDWNRQPRFPESFRSDNPTGHGMMIGIDAGESALN